MELSNWRYREHCSNSLHVRLYEVHLAVVTAFARLEVGHDHTPRQAAGGAQRSHAVSIGAVSKRLRGHRRVVGSADRLPVLRSKPGSPPERAPNKASIADYDRGLQRFDGARSEAVLAT
jgi:hypothetical protein